jgi:hypothetical protein
LYRHCRVNFADIESGNGCTPRTATGEERIRRECNQFRRVFAKTIRVAQTKAEVEAQIVAGGPAVFILL